MENGRDGAFHRFSIMDTAACGHFCIGRLQRTRGVGKISPPLKMLMSIPSLSSETSWLVGRLGVCLVCQRRVFVCGTRRESLVNRDRIISAIWRVHHGRDTAGDCVRVRDRRGGDGVLPHAARGEAAGGGEVRRGVRGQWQGRRVSGVCSARVCLHVMCIGRTLVHSLPWHLSSWGRFALILSRL